MTFRNAIRCAAVLAAVAVAAPPAHAQQPAAPAYPSPELGAMAPDFSIVGATRYGVLKDSIRLSEYRGNTVVLAFFFKARTKG